MWRYILVKILLFGSLGMLAQTNVSTSEILAKALTEPGLKQHDRELDFLKNTDHDLPWLDGMEIRTETDEMDWERQEYLFRLSLNSTEERKAQRNLHEKNIQLAEIEKEQILEEALMERYISLVKFLHLHSELKIREQQKTVLEDRLNVLRKTSLATGTVKLLDLISTEDELHEMEQEIMELIGDLKAIASILSVNENQNIAFDNTLKTSDLQDILSAIQDNSPNNPEAIERQLEIDRSIAEYNFEDAANKRILDFVQMKYSGRDNLSFGQELSFGMGFNIPLKSTERLDMNELALERIENENRLEAYLLRRAERLSETRRELTLLFEKHALAKQQLAESQTAFSLENYPQSEGADPLILLKIKESELNRLRSISEIEKDIYLSYLNLIGLSGKVAERPLRNYLTVGFEVME